MYVKVINKNTKSHREKRYYFLVRNNDSSSMNISTSPKKKRIKYLNLGALDAVDLSRLAKIFHNLANKEIKTECPEKSECKRKILSLWKQQGRMNDKKGRKLIGKKMFFKHFGGMLKLYKELDIPVPKRAGITTAHSDETLLESLRKALRVTGSLSKKVIIQHCIAQPSTYIKRFNSLPNAYKKVGFERR